MIDHQKTEMNSIESSIELNDDEDKTSMKEMLFNIDQLKMRVMDLVDLNRSESEIESYVRNYSTMNKMDLLLARRLMKDVLNSLKVNQLNEKVKSSKEIAQRFINHFSEGKSKKKFINYEGAFYVYKEGKWEVISQQELRPNLVRFIQTNSELDNVRIKTKVDDVLEHMNSILFVPKQEAKSFWISEGLHSGDHICLENGLLNITKLLRKDADYFIPHDPDYFTTIKLPYKYDLLAKCPVWLKFLGETFDDPEIITLIQEWFGLNLIYDTSFEKFVVLIGQGANGKSVILIVLSELVGHENISHVGLEAFSAQRTFMLAGMDGKLANIVNEIGDVDKVAEGVLKDITSGGYMNIERKFVNSYKVKATARLTFATNNYPRSSDRSQGVWRRAIIIPFEKQILDESMQDKRLGDARFWKSSGELNGVFLWALEGLTRLKARGHFIEPKSLKEEKEKYRLLSNPALEFLTHNYEYSYGQDYSKRMLFQEYRDFCKDSNFMPLHVNNFAAEVKKAFPQVKASQHLKTIDHLYPHIRRDRVWIGLAKMKEKINEIN